jgi:hypothetical protein
VVCALSAAQLALKQGNDVASAASLDECDALLSALTQAQPGGAALRLHACVLRALSCLRRGDNKAAAPAADKLPLLLARAKQDAARTYEWMALHALDALLHVARALLSPPPCMRRRVWLNASRARARDARARHALRRRWPPCATAPAPASSRRRESTRRRRWMSPLVRVGRWLSLALSRTHAHTRMRLTRARPRAPRAQPSWRRWA